MPGCEKEGPQAGSQTGQGPETGREKEKES